MKICRSVGCKRLLAAAGLLVAVCAAVRADEGMWLLNNPPAKLLDKKYGFTPQADWLGHLQRASVRFNSGGSGSFVSADGLVMTNHHVGADALQKLSTQDQDYVSAGFHAQRREEEIRCLDLELNVLMSIEDVTARVGAAIKPGSDPAEAQKARRAVMNTIEKESLDQTGLRSDVITLYHGGLYHLYRFKKYTDVRLVFAPEQDIAFFGGDPDNFEYPRYDLDICFFRVYEDGKPVRPPHFLRWSASGAGDGELIFVSGHPGKTERLNTVAHLEFMRDRALPHALNKLRRAEIVLSTFSERSQENARRAQDDLFGVQNSRKALLGKLAGLQDPAVMRRKTAEEKAFRQEVLNHDRLKQDCGDAWADIAATLRTWEGIFVRYDLLEHGSAVQSELFHIARWLLRLAEESGRPNAERLREYRESNLESLKQLLFSEAPIYDDLETVRLADSLGMYIEMAGARDALVRKVLSGKSPQERAAALVRGTKLKDVAFRKQLAEGGLAAVQSSDDPMIALARLVDPAARALRKTYEEKIEEPQRQAYGRIANARFALRGTDVYPDATFTLRLAFGVVKGYQELGQQIPAWTTIGGAFRHAEAQGSKPPFNLPASWLRNRDRLDLSTPMNLVATADIIGGNSGSPVVNRGGELVGIIFDGNIQSLPWDFAFDEKQGRAVAVHCRAIVEALRKIYDAGPLADELGR
jgi:hypothetical protein